MTDERQLRELEELNKHLLEANTSLRRSLARMETLLLKASYGVSMFLALAIVMLLLLALYPLALSYAQTVFNPTNVPKDYERVNNYIEKVGGKNAQVFWLPNFRQGFQYTWAPNKRVGPFNTLSSNQSIGSFQQAFRVDSYINWLEALWQPQIFPEITLKNTDVMLKTDLGSRLLAPFSAGYVIVDSSVPDYDFVKALSGDATFKPVFKSGSLQVYGVTGGPDIVWPAHETLKVNNYWDHLAIMQKLAPEQLIGKTFIDGKDSVGKKYGQLDMREYEGENLIHNPGFEEGYGLIPFLSWDKSAPGIPFEISPDKLTKVSGKASIKVVNKGTAQFNIGWVLGDEIPAFGDSVYIFESHVKYTNANWTSVVIEGYRPSTGEWIQLVQCPGIRAGTIDWQKYYISFYLPRGITRIRPLLAAGWSLDASKGPAISWFDDLKLNRIGDRFFADIVDRERPGEITVKYKKLSAIKYKVHVRNPGGPFVLAFAQSYDPPWVAILPNGKTVRPVQLYSTTCGFPISQKGTFDLTIEYRPEGWFHVGFVVAMLGLLICALYLLWVLRKRGGMFASAASAAGAALRDLRWRAGEAIEFPPRIRPVSRRGPSPGKEPGTGTRSLRAWDRTKGLGNRISEHFEYPPRRKQ